MTGKKGISLEDLAIAVVDQSAFRRKVAEIREKRLKEEAELARKPAAAGKNKKRSEPE